jgi:CBS-domain-containing membrane protein
MELNEVGMNPDVSFLAAPAWLTSLAILALAGVRGALWIRQAKFNGGQAGAGPINGPGARTAERTLVLVERQQEDLEAALRILGEQQTLMREDQAVRKQEHEAKLAMIEQLASVAQSFNKSASVLTAMNFNVEAAHKEIVNHRSSTVGVVKQVGEIHRAVVGRPKKSLR